MTLVFEVTGTGYFPIDMLRYDRAWPADDSWAFQKAMAGALDGSQTTVRLHSDKPPTIERWESFDWKVVELGNQ